MSDTNATWTTDKPTEEGWYWWSASEFSQRAVFKAGFDESVSTISWIHQSHPGCQWFPVATPEQVAQLEKDAARYRWLRDSGNESWAPLVVTGLTPSAAEIDAAIDKAIKEKTR